MPSASSEEAQFWIQQIAQKDRQAFARFYDHFSPLAYSLALRMLRSKPDADDLIQEVFLQIWHQASKYDPNRGKPEAWITTITKSRAIDKLRSYRRKEQGGSGLEDQARSRAFDAESGTQNQAEARWELEGAFKELSSIQREALEKAYFEGKTQTEIASELNLPVGTVKTRIRDGLLKLRQQLLIEGSQKS